MKCRYYLWLRYPCGQCIACRMNKQKEKAIRLQHELQYHKDNVFVSLTYKPECLPEKCSLVKRDVQLFLKRLRKAIEPQKIRYFLCGEYGSGKDEEYYIEKYGRPFGRPHYHLIIFGLNRIDKRVFRNLKYKSENQSYECDCDIWDKGFVEVSDVTTRRIAYVAKYCLKKVTGMKAEDYYKGCLPEFSLCSRKPGLGYQYARDHSGRLKEDDYVVSRGVKSAIPRYYVDKIFDDAEKCKRKWMRARFREDAYNKEVKPIIDTYGKDELKFRLQEKVNAENELFYRKMQRKGKTKCQIN